MTLKDATHLLHMNWHQIKVIDKAELRKRYENRALDNVRILSSGEISICKHHKYLTVISIPKY